MDPLPAPAVAERVDSVLNGKSEVVRDQEFIAPFISIKRQDESVSKWNTFKSGHTLGRLTVVRATVEASEHISTTVNIPLPSALRKPTITQQASKRIISDVTYNTYPDGDTAEDEPSLNTTELPEESSQTYPEAKHMGRVTAVTFGNVEVRDHSLSKEHTVIGTVEEYEAQRRSIKRPPQYVPKDAPTKKSLTYETMRVQGTTTAPKPAQVAHHEPSPPQESLYHDFEEKFQSKRTKKKSFFWGLFKRRSTKKRDLLDHM